MKNYTRAGNIEITINPIVTLKQFIEMFCCEDTYVHVTDSLEEETTTISYDGQIKEFVNYPDEHTTILGRVVKGIDVCSDGYLLIQLEAQND